MLYFAIYTEECNAFEYQKDWSQQVVPDIWPEATPRTPITTVEWMREAELKHGRLSMLAVVVLILLTISPITSSNNSIFLVSNRAGLLWIPDYDSLARFSAPFPTHSPPTMPPLPTDPWGMYVYMYAYMYVPCILYTYT